MTNFVAIDFETTNQYRSSVCSIGIVIVRNGKIVDRFYSLIHPLPNFYTHWTSEVHGLTHEDTDSAPTFPEVWKQIEPLIKGLPFVAHNSPFDEGCLRAVFEIYEMEYPDYTFYCTLRAPRKLQPDLSNHRLDTVAKTYDYNLVNHHNAIADTEACAAIALKLYNMEEKNIFNDGLISHPLVKIIGLGNTSYILNELNSKYSRIISIDKFDDNNNLSLNGEVMGIVVVGDYDDEFSDAVSVLSGKVKLLLVLSTQEVTPPKGVDSLMVGNVCELHLGIKVILDILQLPNLIACDFIDICNLLKDSGRFNIISIEQEGKNPITTAIPKVNQRYKEINGNKMLINIAFNPENRTQVMAGDISSFQLWLDSLPHKIDVVWGVSCDDSLKYDSIRIDIITIYNELKS